MIKKLLRGLVPLTLALTPVLTATPAQAAPALLPDALSALPVADESRTGYTRTAFKHWNAGADSTDGCNTRQEVLIAEAIEAPTVGAGCSITGGKWLSYYDPGGHRRERARHRPHGPARRGMGLRGLRLECGQA